MRCKDNLQKWENNMWHSFAIDTKTHTVTWGVRACHSGKDVGKVCPAFKYQWLLLRPC